MHNNAILAIRKGQHKQFALNPKLELSILRKRKYLAVFAFATLLIDRTDAEIPESEKIEIDVDAPRSSWMAGGGPRLEPASAHSIRNAPPMTIGHFNFPVSIPTTGWYRLDIATERGWTHSSATMISREKGIRNGHLVDRLDTLVNGRSAWSWLKAGDYDLRISSDYWTGLPAVNHLVVRRWKSTESAPFRIMPRKLTVFPTNRCEYLRVLVGGIKTAYSIRATFTRSGHQYRTEDYKVSSGSHPYILDVPIACDISGDFSVLLSPSPSDSLTPLQAMSINYSVFDTSPANVEIKSGKLVFEISAANHEPDYQSCQSKPLHSRFSSYRESGDRGSTPFARRHGTPPLPCWFTYRMSGLEPGRIYRLHFYYPDDADRVMVFAVKDGGMRGYPPSLGVETGGPWPLSKATHSRILTFRATSTQAQAMIINVHDRRSAALEKVELYEALINLSPDQKHNHIGGRRLSLWYEEGGNYRHLFSQSGDDKAIYDPVNHFMMMAKSSGATSVTFSASVYNFALYRARHERLFVDGRDDLTAFLLSGERYGISIVPEIYPTASELLWSSHNAATAKERLLLSAAGKFHALRANGTLHSPPYYNLLDSKISQWMEDLLYDIGLQYSQYNKLEGVQLRVSPWRNSGLTNLVSLDWGYNASTVRQFFLENKIPIPKDLDIRNDKDPYAEERAAFLLSNLRTRWINWRCDKVVAYYRRLVGSLQRARPDLTLTLWIDANEDFRGKTAEQMREQGLDLTRLAQIPGIRIRDASLRYGAREADLNWRTQWRNAARTPERYSLVPRAAEGRQIFNYMQYLEVVGSAIPSEKIGLPEAPKSRWISAAALPPMPYAQERLAYALAFGDAVELGDGGNGYVFFPDSQQEFLTSFTCLPAKPFSVQSGVKLPLTLRRWRNNAYVVNLSADSQRIYFSWSGTKSPITLCGGRAFQRIMIIPPYGLISLKLAPNSDISVQALRP